MANEALRWDLRTHYFLWIAAAHSTQYLWVTAYYARQSGEWRGQLPHYAKVLAAGAAAWTIPVLLFGTHTGGPLAFDAGLGLLVAAAVNVHHFILDGAIWKLRGPIAQILIRSDSLATETGDAIARPAAGRLVWAGCFAALALSVGAVAVEQRTVPPSSGRTSRRCARAPPSSKRRAGERLAPARLRQRAARRAAHRGGARELPARPGAAAERAGGSAAGCDLRAGGRLAARGGPLRGRPREAAFGGERTAVLALAGKAWQRLGDDERALARLEEALARDPQNAQLAALIELSRRPLPSPERPGLAASSSSTHRPVPSSRVEAIRESMPRIRRARPKVACRGGSRRSRMQAVSLRSQSLLAIYVFCAARAWPRSAHRPHPAAAYLVASRGVTSSRASSQSTTRSSRATRAQVKSRSSSAGVVGAASGRRPAACARKPTSSGAV